MLVLPVLFDLFGHGFKQGLCMLQALLERPAIVGSISSSEDYVWVVSHVLKAFDVILAVNKGISYGNLCVPAPF